MNNYRFQRPPAVLLKAKLDNIAIVPASMMVYKDKYQAFANNLPQGDILVILPQSETSTKKALQTVISMLKSKGRTVTTISSTQFG